MEVKEPEAPKPSQNNTRGGEFDLLDDTSLQNLPEEAVRSKNETRDAISVRLAYQEIQLKYLRLEQKYRALGQQYRAQKQV